MNNIKHKKVTFICKNAKKVLTFGNVEIEKNKFYLHKTTASLRDVDILKVLVSNQIYFGEKNYKYFIGYLYNDHKVKPLHLILPKTSTIVKSYVGKTKQTYFLIEDDDLLEEYNTIWYKVSADIKKEYDSEPVCNKEYLKTKLKSYGDEIQVFTIKNILRETLIILVQQ